MNTFNKFLVILMVLGSIFLWFGAIFSVWFLADKLLLALRDTAFLLRDNTMLVRGFVTAFGVSAILVALLVLTGEFSPGQPKVIRLRSVAGGSAVVTIEAMTARLKAEIERVPLIQMARPKVNVRKNAADVVVELRTAGPAHLPTVADDVCNVVREVMDSQMGTELRSVRVAFQQAGRGNQGMQAAKGPITIPASQQGAPPGVEGDAERQPPG
ncbi:MAG: hypothetical protein EXR51_03670 [Dehalococcoidia bacterium]|nr:hypothetical protein [Dehalococcoidia bacterium]